MFHEMFLIESVWNSIQNCIDFPGAVITVISSVNQWVQVKTHDGIYWFELSINKK